ncbi:hypothetical protein FQN60_014932 [Etheostoma spectabile]|uniref:Ig-like domain-containing protein n=1 Tax=Etheostoma spectabile TaxID=54343 RepID=A0A5J5CQK3_9PERO|nr:hypothetical protein FQN60_014932 [Etheostoma spectabile]
MLSLYVPHLILAGLIGMPSLYVDHQEIIAFEGRSVTVRCHCKDPKITQWCRLGGTCVSDQTGSIDGTTVTINDSVPNGFTVTLMELKTESSGWYWCNNGDFQMPVHVTVHESTTTTTTTLPNTANLTGRLPTTQHSSLLTNAEPHTAQPTNSTINRAGGENLQDEHKSSTIVTILSTTLVLLLLVVPAAFFGWRMMIKDKTKLEGSDITVQNNLPKESVTYSTIVIKDSVRQLTEPVDGILSAQSPTWLFTFFSSSLDSQIIGGADVKAYFYLSVTRAPLATRSHLTTSSPEPVSAFDHLKHFLIPLSLLIFIVMVLLLIWLMLKRHKQTRADSSATTTALDLGGQASIATPSLCNSLPQRSDEKSELDGTYSSVVIVGQQTPKRVEARDEDVTYSMLAQHQQNL